MGAIGAMGAMGHSVRGEGSSKVVSVARRSVDSWEARPSFDLAAGSVFRV